MSVTTLLSFAEFEQFPDDGYKHELLEGEHVMAPPAEFNHSDCQHRIQDLLRPRAKGRGRIYLETGFQIGEHSWLQPYVSLVTNEQIQRRAGKYLQGSPLLAIEVVSESNTADEIEHKTRLFLKHGAEEVWVVYPKPRCIWVYRGGETSATCHTDELRSHIFPDLRLDVKALFA